MNVVVELIVKESPRKMSSKSPEPIAVMAC